MPQVADYVLRRFPAPAASDSGDNRRGPGRYETAAGPSGIVRRQAVAGRGPCPWPPGVRWAGALRRVAALGRT